MCILILIILLNLFNFCCLQQTLIGSEEKFFRNDGKFLIENISDNIFPTISFTNNIEIVNNVNQKSLELKPVKLTMKQGLLMNQVLSFYALKNIQNKECQNHINEFKNALRAFQPWALKSILFKITGSLFIANFAVFDSSSKLQSGILIGNLYDFGSYLQCLRINESVKTGRILGKHCVLTIVPNIYLIKKVLQFKGISDKRFQKIKKLVESSKLSWSVCIPHSCPVEDILEHFQKVVYEIGEGLNLTVTLNKNHCTTSEDSPQMGLYQYLTLTIYGTFILLGIIATIADHYSLGDESKFVQIFSIISNINKLFQKGLAEQEYNFLHGFRFISSCMVVLGHRYIEFMKSPTINRLDITDWILEIPSAIILGNTTAVDSFFLVSGMLVSIGFFQYVRETRKFNLWKYYIHRYLRITAPLSLTVLFHCTLVQFLASGPLMFDALQAHQRACQNYWWSSLLHIQFLINPHHLCIYPIWYLSCEMAFYFVSPIILYPLWKRKFLGFFTIGFFFSLSVFFAFYLAWLNKYSGGTLPITDQLFSEHYLKYYYIQPHTRFIPYIVGMSFGYIITHLNERKIYIQNSMVLLGWTATFLLIGITLYYNFSFEQENHEYNRFESSSFFVLIRISWSAVTLWIMFACLYGYGGFINIFLSSHFFRVLSRISYGIFLWHTSLQIYKSANSKTPMYYSNFNIVVYHGFADVAILIIVCLFFAIFYEFPLIQLERLLFKVKRKTRRIKHIEVQQIRTNRF